MRAMGWLLALCLIGCGTAPVSNATASVGTSKWVMLGDSITHLSFGGGEDPPQFVEAGTPGATSTDAVARVNDLVAANPDARGVALAYGTNDALKGNRPEDFQAMMEVAVERVLARGKRVMIPRIPYGTAAGLVRVPEFNAVVASLAAAHGLPAGPDLYGWFQAHPDQLQADGIHPNAEGQAAVRSLWEAAIAASQAR